jgi:arginine decarboxylase
MLPLPMCFLEVAQHVSLAFMAPTVGLNMVVVLEQEELGMVIEASRRLGMHPVVGMRAKL